MSKVISADRLGTFRHARRVSSHANGAPLILPWTKIYYREVEVCPR